jgi:molybdopterin synthase sulfur carrier subunit
MECHLRVPTPLRALCDDRAHLTVEVPDGGTVAEVLAAVAERYPALERRVCDERGRLRVHVNLFLGDDNVRDLDGTATVLSPGADLTLLAAISGG